MSVKCGNDSPASRLFTHNTLFTRLVFPCRTRKGQLKMPLHSRRERLRKSLELPNLTCVMSKDSRSERDPVSRSGGAAKAFRPMAGLRLCALAALLWRRELSAHCILRVGSPAGRDSSQHT